MREKLKETFFSLAGVRGRAVSASLCAKEKILEIQLDFLVNYQTKDIVELNDI